MKDVAVMCTLFFILGSRLRSRFLSVHSEPRAELIVPLSVLVVPKPSIYTHYYHAGVIQRQCRHQANPRKKANQESPALINVVYD